MYVLVLFYRWAVIIFAVIGRIMHGKMVPPETLSTYSNNKSQSW